MEKIYLIIYAIVVFVHLLTCITRNMNVKKTTKLFLMPLLMLIYFDLTKDNKSDSLARRRKTIINGILLGFQGDFLLIFDSNKCFMYGLLSFLVGHFLYIYAISRRIGQFNSLPTIFGITFSHLMLSALLESKLLATLKDKVFKYAAVVYGMVLTILNSLAIYYFITNTCLHSLLLMIGTTLFAISDGILAYNCFIHHFKLGDFCVMATYIPAQTLIAVGMSMEK